MNILKTALHSAFPAIMAILIAGGTALASPPSAPLGPYASTTVATVNGLKKSVILLYWKPGGSYPWNHAGFRIYGKLDQNSVQFALLGEVRDSTTFSFTVTTLQAAGTYRFRVDAFNPDGQAPGAEISLAYNPSDTGNVSGGNTVKFTSTLPGSASVNKPWLYRANAVSENGEAIGYALEWGPPGMILDPASGMVTWTPSVNGLFKVSIRAFVSANPSNYASQAGVVTVGDTTPRPVGIRFVSTSQNRALAGKEYLYDARAITDNGAAVAYSLSPEPNGQIPSGMVVDPVSGRLSWTPANGGQTVSLYMVASLLSDPSVSAQQHLSITVWNCAEPAIVTGTVKDQNGISVGIGGDSSTVVYAISANTGAYTISMVQKDGTYRLELDEGDYGISVKSAMMMSIPPTVRVSVRCAQTASADLMIERNALVISGRVVRADESPVESARVDVMGYDPSDAARAKMIGMISVRTDRTGGYQAVVSGGNYSYIVRAIAPSDSFLVQYYDKSADATHARVLKGGNTTLTGIDFALSPRSVYDNVVSGFVHDSAGSPVSAIVVAYRVDAGTDPQGVAKALTGSAGQFTLTNLEPGAYVLRVLPMDTTALAAGYYRQGIPLVVSWHDATTLKIGDGLLISGLDVLVPRAHRNGGISRLNGAVGGNGGVSLKQGSAPQSAALPVAEALISISDDAGAILGYAVSADDGSFSVTGLAPGTHTLTADMVGYRTYTVRITVSDAQPLTGIIITLSDGTSGVDNQGTTGQDGMSLTAEPNLSSSVFRLRFAAGGGNMRATVIDMTGREVFKTNLEETAGTCPVDLSPLPAGAYFIRVHNGIRSGAVRVVVTK